MLVITGAVVTSGLGRLRLDPDILSMLPGKMPEVQSLKTLRDSFAGSDDLVLAVEAPDAETAGLATTTLAGKLRDSGLCRQVQDGDAMENPATAGALLAWAIQNGPPDRLRTLREKLAGPEAVQRHLQWVLEELAGSPDPGTVQRWQYDPLGLLGAVDLGRMTALRDSGFGSSSADGAFRMIFAAPGQKLGGYREAERWLGAVNQVIGEWRRSDAKFSQVAVKFTGEPAFMAEIGGGIERDLGGTLGVGTVLIVALFWLMHRRWMPLLWILLLMGVSIGLSLSLAGLVVGKITVMSLGFASIVLGIVVDYGVLILQEARDHPQLGAAGVRRLAIPGILAGAATTAAVFFALLFIGLPGIAELGLLVGINVVAGAAVMLIFMPGLAVWKRLDAEAPVKPSALPVSHRAAWWGTVVLVVTLTVVFAWGGLPAFDGGAAALRPTRSEASKTWDLIQQRLGREHEAAVPMILTTRLGEAQASADRATRLLNALQREGVIRRHALPSMFFPQPEHQTASLEHLRWFVANRKMLADAVTAEGFTEETLVLFNHVVDAWQRDLDSGVTAPRNLPEGPAAEVLARFLHVAPDNVDSASHTRVVALGAVTLPGSPGNPDRATLRELHARVGAEEGMGLAAWETLGEALSTRVRQDITREMLPLIVILLIMLGIAYRNWKDLLLSVVLLALGVGCLLAAMVLLGQSWNLASLAALPLLLGTGIDYGIHTLLGMRREKNDIRRMRHTIGRAVFFCGATTVIGFMSLVVADNRGVASLGIACAAGTVWILLLVLWLLPHWRCWLDRR